MRSSLLVEAKNLLWTTLDDVTEQEECQKDTTTTFATDVAAAASTATNTTTVTHNINHELKNDNNEDVDDNIVMIHKKDPPSSTLSSPLTILMVRKLATLYDHLCETLSLDTLKDDNNNNPNTTSLVGMCGILQQNHHDIPTTKTTTPISFLQQPRQLQIEWELYQALHLTSLHLLVVLQKTIVRIRMRTTTTTTTTTMPTTMESSASRIEVIERHQTTLLNTIQQCQYVGSLLSSLLYDDDDESISLSITTDHSVSWQQQIQYIMDQYPTLLLSSPSPPTTTTTSNQKEDDDEEQDDDDTNLLSYLNKEDLAMEEQTLMQMAETPIPPLPLGVFTQYYGKRSIS
jgi:hypothetical protein